MDGERVKRVQFAADGPRNLFEEVKQLTERLGRCEQKLDVMIRMLSSGVHTGSEAEGVQKNGDEDEREEEEEEEHVQQKGEKEEGEGEGENEEEEKSKEQPQQVAEAKVEPPAARETQEALQRRKSQLRTEAVILLGGAHMYRRHLPCRHCKKELGAVQRNGHIHCRFCDHVLLALRSWSLE